jgi:hypothetical protein
MSMAVRQAGRQASVYRERVREGGRRLCLWLCMCLCLCICVCMVCPPTKVIHYTNSPYVYKPRAQYRVHLHRLRGWCIILTHAQHTHLSPASLARSLSSLSLSLSLALSLSLSFSLSICLLSLFPSALSPLSPLFLSTYKYM